MPGRLDQRAAVSSVPRPTKSSEYKVYWNKPQKKRVLVLQFPNKKKDDGLNESLGSKPLELRLKPQSGLIEIDIPILFDNTYDKVRGVQYGRALKQSRTLQSNGDYGMAGGFGTPVHVKSGRETGRPAHGDEGEEAILENFDVAQNDGYALQKLTLGGRIIPFKKEDPIYAIGAFNGSELHLTKVDAICQLQPQFHHLDAFVDNEKTSSRASAPGDHVESQAHAVNLAVKSTDDEELDMSEVGKTLKGMQEESWQRLAWVDEDAPQAYKIYKSDLMLDGGLKGKHLVSSLNEKQYLDVMSAPRIDPIDQGQRVMLNRPWSSGSDSDMSTDEEELET